MTALEEIKKALEGVTPGPWKWFGNASSNHVYLATTHSGRRYVMDFVRWGMKGAQPRFQPERGGMVDAKDLLQFEVGDRDIVGMDAAKKDGSVYRYDVRGIDCPDARYIAAVNPAAISELLSTLESLQRENEELHNLADRLKQEAQIHAMEARSANSTVNEIYQIISGSKGEPGNWRGAKPVREYVEAAKGEILRLETELALSNPVYSRRQIEDRVKVLEEALKPFAEYMGDHFDKDNHGDPIPDNERVGWIYLTHADFRRARQALASTGGEHNGN